MPPSTSTPRHDFFQTPQYLTVSLYLKGYAGHPVSVSYHTHRVDVSLPAIPGADDRSFSVGPLAGAIIPGECTERVLGTKVSLYSPLHRFCRRQTSPAASSQCRGRRSPALHIIAEPWTKSASGGAEADRQALGACRTLAPAVASSSLLFCSSTPSLASSSLSRRLSLAVPSSELHQDGSGETRHVHVS